MHEIHARLAALEAKVRALETQNRRIKIGALIGVVCVCASLALAGASPASTASKSIILTDPQTGIQAELSTKGLHFKDKAGKALLDLWVDPKIGSGLVFFDTVSKQGRLGIGMWGKHAGLGMESAAAHEIAWFGEEDKGTRLDLYDDSKSMRFEATAYTDSPATLKLYGPSGSQTWGAP